MSGRLDLDVDTSWIRRAAATLEETAHGFRSVAAPDGDGPVVDGTLGQSPSAASAAALVNLRTAGAGDAAAQLGSIAAGLADRLTAAADDFDRAELAVTPWPR